MYKIDKRKQELFFRDMLGQTSVRLLALEKRLDKEDGVVVVGQN